MKNQLVATLVAAILIFIWQFLTWSQLNVHGNEFQYTDKQDAILQMLEQQQLKTGNYMMPRAPEGAGREQEAELMKNSMNKPWAIIQYHESFQVNMPMNLIRGFVVDLLSAFLLVWLLSKMANLTFSRALLASWAVGAIAYLTIPYLNSIWFEGNTMGYLVDLVVQWGLVGAWLGWYMTRK